MRQDLLNALAQIQNHPTFEHQDIMTFAGLMDEDEIRQHIEASMGRVARWSETPVKAKRSHKKKVR